MRKYDLMGEAPVRIAVLLSLLMLTPARAEMSMFRALALGCISHFKSKLTKEAAAFCSCSPEAVLTKDNVKAIEEAQGVMNQEIRMLLDEAGDKCLKNEAKAFTKSAREWIENEK